MANKSSKLTQLVGAGNRWQVSPPATHCKWVGFGLSLKPNRPGLCIPLTCTIPFSLIRRNGLLSSVLDPKNIYRLPTTKPIGSFQLRLEFYLALVGIHHATLFSNFIESMNNAGMKIIKLYRPLSSRVDEVCFESSKADRICQELQSHVLSLTTNATLVLTGLISNGLQNYL